MAATAQKMKYVELADLLRERIRNGELKIGERLPTYTELYDKHGVSTVTVQRACDLLDQEQLIVRRHGSGVFVAPPQRNLSGNIGMIGSPGFNSQDIPFYSSLMSSVHEALEEDQRHMLYLGSQDSWDSSVAAKVDGVLFCGQDEAESVFRKLPAHLPRVAMLTNVDNVTCVGVDNHRGAQMAVRHLMKFGHKRIACLMEDKAWEARRRLAGYSDALAEKGIEADSTWKRLAGPPNVKTSQPYLEWGRNHMRAWLQDGWKETGCTAILAQNDLAAIGVMQVLQAGGIKVPEEVSVMGFDGTDLCNIITPHLSAVAVPLGQIGLKAVELLNRQIAGEPSSSEMVSLPWSLRQGESVALAP